MIKLFLIDSKIIGWLNRKFVMYINLFQQVFAYINQMFNQIQVKISGLLQREFNSLMGSQRFIRGLVLVLKYGFALLVVILLGSVISMLVQFIMAALLAAIKYIINILAHIAETMKDNLILLGILILVLAFAQRISISSIIYRAFAVLISGDDPTCAVCFVHDLGPCDYIEPICGNAFHKQHMDDWLQNNETCPLCRQKVPVIGRRCQKVVYLEFFKHMLRLRKVQSGLIILGFLFFNAVFYVI